MTGREGRDDSNRTYVLALSRLACHIAIGLRFHTRLALLFAGHLCMKNMRRIDPLELKA